MTFCFSHVSLHSARAKSHQLSHEYLLPHYYTFSHGITHCSVPWLDKSDFSRNFLNGLVLVLYAADGIQEGDRPAWYSCPLK
jgi:hypothetical protein